jgi:predicted ATPase
MEKIKINGFGGLKNAEVQINNINVFIGKSASGKSITIKLIYFFKSFFREFFEAAENEETKSELNKKLLVKFEEFFPFESWNESTFEIIFYYNENDYSKITKASLKSKITIEYSKTVFKQYNNAKRLIKVDKEKFQAKDKFEVYRPDFKVFERYINLVKTELGEKCAYSQIFIPAGRSFFATLQSSIFSFLSNNKAIDPFLVEFGSFYENIKGIVTRESISSKNKTDFKIIDDLIIEILGGKYQRIKSKDYIIHEDKRKINLAYASSGQQETLPLALILKALTKISFTGGGITLYIEEPEAHLFPSAQKKVVELIVSVFKLSKCESQIILTTHSPYIISSFNNLLQAGLIEEKNNDERLYEIVNKLFIIPKNNLNAVSVEKQQFKSILDEDFCLIDSEYLDSISSIISNEFNQLIDFEHEL